MKEKRDCFADSGNKCKILKEKRCEGCSFYKTKEQYEKDRQKALERICLLDENTRSRIIEKYHGGKK